MAFCLRYNENAAAGEEQKGERMEGFNTLDFKMIDPAEAGEEWAVDSETIYRAVEIYIDGREILEIIREIEIPYVEEDEHVFAGDYGHVSPKSLYGELSSATDEGSFSHSWGVYLFCCGSCGEPTCWSVTILVKEDGESVYWYDFRHEHMAWDYNLTYRFEKNQYARAMQKLKNMAALRRIGPGR